MEQHFELKDVVKSLLLQMHQNFQWIRIKVCRQKLARTSAALVPRDRQTDERARPKIHNNSVGKQSVLCVVTSDVRSLVGELRCQLSRNLLSINGVLQNAAIFWYNYKRSGEMDDLSLHAACPVLIGEKWGELSSRDEVESERLSWPEYVCAKYTNTRDCIFYNAGSLHHR